MISPGKLEDIDALVELGRQMAKESPRWGRLAYSEQRVRSTLTELIKSPDGLVLVARRGEAIIGGVLAVMSFDWMSDQRTAQEMALYVAPEYRASMTACRLVCGLLAWARIKGAVWVEAGVSTGVHPDRTAALYEKMGFERCAIMLENRNV